MNLSAIIWLILMIIFLITEAATVVLTSLWFAAGALAAMVASLLGAPLWLQILLFLAVSAVLLSFLRPMVSKHLTPRLAKTNVDAIVGSQGYVLSDIDNISATGKVKLGAMEWTARSTCGDPIPAGTLVQVDKVEGVKVFVSPAKVVTTV